jgi:hypothetical protein
MRGGVVHLLFSLLPVVISSHHYSHIYATKYRVEERLNEYSHRFDVVLLGDGDLSYVIALLNELVGEDQGGAGVGNGAS